MVMGVVSSALICVLGSGMVGWSLGFVVDTLKSREEIEVEMVNESQK
jgi:hypothetical protein